MNIDGKEGGLLEGAKHSDPGGGIKAINVDNNDLLEVESEEFIVKADAMKSDDTHVIDGEEKTNAEIIEDINKKQYADGGLIDGGYWGNIYLDIILGEVEIMVFFNNQK